MLSNHLMSGLGGERCRRKGMTSGARERGDDEVSVMAMEANIEVALRSNNKAGAIGQTLDPS